MNKKLLPLISSVPKKKHLPESKRLRVSEQTLAFLRSFASNYYVEQQLPQGLQGIILG